MFMPRNEVKPGNGCSNSRISFDINKPHAEYEMRELLIEVSGKLDVSTSTTIYISDITQQDLRDMALILNRLADSMAD